MHEEDDCRERSLVVDKQETVVVGIPMQISAKGSAIKQVVFFSVDLDYEKVVATPTKEVSSSNVELLDTFDIFEGRIT